MKVKTAIMDHINNNRHSSHSPHSSHVETRKIELLNAIEKQNENIRSLNLYLEGEKSKLVKMTEELDSLSSSNQDVYCLNFINSPRIYEPLRF
jgi:hypothetical protein